MGLCLTPWTSHTGTVYNGTSRAAHVTLPLHSPAPPAPPPRRLARTLGAAYAPYPRVPHFAPTTAIAPAAVLLAMCAEVNRLGYVHARRQSPSSLLVGLGDALYAL